MKKILFSLAALSLAGLFNAQSWTSVETGAPAVHFVNVLKAVDANTLWFSDTAANAATDKGRYIGLSTDGGTTWANKLISGPSASASIGDISAVSATTAWIVSSGSGAQNGIWKTTNAGTTWTKQTTASFNNTNPVGPSFANIVHFWDENNGFAAGDPFGTSSANLRFEMYTTTDGGTNWTNLGVGVAPAPLNGAEFGYTSKITVQGNNVWLGTDVGRLLYSSNKGASWQAFQTPAVDFGGITVDGFTADVAFKDTTKGLLISNEGGVALLYSSVDSGANWTSITPTGTFYPTNIVYVPGTVNTYVTSSDEGSSFTTDGGQTWTDIEYDPTTAPYKGPLAFLNTTTGFAGGVSQASISNLPVAGMYKFEGNLNLAVSDVNAVKVKLTAYPNPASDVVNFKGSKEIKGVAIIDASGKIIKRDKTSSQINVSGLSKGTYIAQVQYADGSVENTKVIKK